MIKERCYFMGGPKDDEIIAIPPSVQIVTAPVINDLPLLAGPITEEADLGRMTLTFDMENYIRTNHTRNAPHSLHGEWPITVYAWTR